MQTPNNPNPTPATMRQAQPARSTAGAVLDPRHEDHGDDGQSHPDQHDGVRQAVEDEPDHDRDGGGQHGRDRGDDGHPTDGQGAIQAGDADPAGDPAGHTPTQVRDGWKTLGANDGQAEGHRHTDELGDQDDAEDRGPSAGESTTEVTGPPGGRRDQPEHDGAGRAGQDVDQALGSAGASSLAVGPGSSTTASAAASYRSDVVR